MKLCVVPVIVIVVIIQEISNDQTHDLFLFTFYHSRVNYTFFVGTFHCIYNYYFFLHIYILIQYWGLVLLVSMRYNFILYVSYCLFFSNIGIHKIINTYIHTYNGPGLLSLFIPDVIIVALGKVGWGSKCQE